MMLEKRANQYEREGPEDGCFSFLKSNVRGSNRNGNEKCVIQVFFSLEKREQQYTHLIN